MVTQARDFLEAAGQFLEITRLAEKQARLERAEQVFPKPPESPEGTETVVGE